MKRFLLTSVLALLATFFAAGSAFATTYYIAANGSDSNNGTSKTTPWLHAPGMTGCSGTCASTTPQAGDSFIFRGGDSWHYNSASGTPVGLPWVWTWSGSSTSCQLNAAAGAVVKTSCIYIGVDQSWYSGSSWTRPILNMDNPPTTSRPSTCKYDDTSITPVNLGNRGYLVFDDFEAMGVCWQGGNTPNFVNTTGTQLEVSNNYFHGWTYGSSTTSDNFGQIGGGTPFSAYMLCDHNVFDGSDSSLGGTGVVGSASGMSIYNACTEIAYNIFSHVSNGCICSPLSVHDNLFQYLWEPSGSTHGNIIEWNNENYSLPNVLYFYNNVIHDTNEGEGINYQVITSPVYIFNNVSWLYRENSNGTNGSSGSNCFQSDVGTSTKVNFFNNTLDYPCGISQYGAISGTANVLQNNHLIGYSPQNFSSIIGGSSSNTDNGNEVWQTESAANGEGYVSGSAYAPTSGSNATVGAGANLTGTVCNGISNTVVKAACTVGVSNITYDGTNHIPVITAGNARPLSGAWDAGAYQFDPGSLSGKPNPPTGLSAIAQ